MIFSGRKTPLSYRYMCSLGCSNKEYRSPGVASSMFRRNNQVNLGSSSPNNDGSYFYFQSNDTVKLEINQKTMANIRLLKGSWGVAKYWRRGLSTQGVGNFVVAFLKKDDEFEVYWMKSDLLQKVECWRAIFWVKRIE